jgi:hypothetical protein
MVSVRGHHGLFGHDKIGHIGLLLIVPNVLFNHLSRSLILSNLTKAHVLLFAALHEVSSDRISEVLDWLADECRLPDEMRTGARCTELVNEIPDAADNLVFKHEPPC